MKVASALLKNGKVFIQGYSRTFSGMWVASGKVHACTFGDLEEMAIQARAALAASRRLMRTPKREEWPLIQKPMLEAVGARNWNQLARGAKAVGLEYEKGIVTIEPSANYQNDGGEGLPGKAIRIKIGSDQLGASLMEAFEASS
jgi:hypothetical protein